MNRVVLLKLGGSLLTDKARPGHARAEVIVRLAAEVAEGRRVSGPLIIGHGSGGFGHPAAREHGLSSTRAKRAPGGVSAVLAAAEELHRLVLGELRAVGLPVLSVPPSAWLADRADGPDSADRPRAPDPPPGLIHALDLGMVPVVRGDVILGPDGGRIASTEYVFGELARRLPLAGWLVERVVWATDTPGILADDGRTVREIGADMPAPPVAGPAEGTDVTGGMSLKLAAALDMGRQGIPSVVIDGRRSGAVEQSLRGVEDVSGTRILARRS